MSCSPRAAVLGQCLYVVTKAIVLNGFTGENQRLFCCEIDQVLTCHLPLQPPLFLNEAWKNLDVKFLDS